MVKVVSFRFQHCLVSFTFCLSKGPLKRDFLDIYLTTFYGIRNFRNTSPMRFIIFLKVFKILSTFQKRRTKIEGKLFVF